MMRSRVCLLDASRYPRLQIDNGTIMLKINIEVSIDRLVDDRVRQVSIDRLVDDRVRQVVLQQDAKCIFSFSLKEK